MLRNRLGEREDQFFATVFLGSGLLFVASLFASAGLSGALLETVSNSHTGLLKSDAYILVRRLIGSFLNVFAIKMAGVFVMSTSTIVLRTGILPRWVAFSGFASAIVLLLSITNWPWIALLFPLATLYCARSGRTPGALVHLELSTFATLLRAAQKARATVNRGYYNRVAQALDPAVKERLDRLFVRDGNRSVWDLLKSEPRRPTSRQNFRPAPCPLRKRMSWRFHERLL